MDIEYALFRVTRILLTATVVVAMPKRRPSGHVADGAHVIGEVICELEFLFAAAVVSLATCSLAKSAELTPAARVSSTLWSWTGGYVGFHGGGGYGRTSFTDPYGPSIYGDIVNTPVFLAGGQIGYNWQATDGFLAPSWI
ncbi:hypothetical protein [Bradyrhizobium sp. CCBAU 21360]|uniref:hypothetical protein n=1 Tax=Bradyrhizobium sp. CCBAU 21360 TaxID=1325081 RepID=UPI002305DAF4|nr:hypothetical protein [Bradyrhizobium sp. CCBAU 21360]